MPANRFPAAAVHRPRPDPPRAGPRPPARRPGSPCPIRRPPRTTGRGGTAATPPEEDEPAVPAEPHRPPAASPTSESPPEEPEQSAADADALYSDGDQFPAELAAVLAGSGALLAAGVGAAWLAHRRQRLRRRRPGRRLTPSRRSCRPRRRSSPRRPTWVRATTPRSTWRCAVSPSGFPRTPTGRCPTSSPPDCTAAGSSRGCTPRPTVRRPNRGPPTTPACGGSCGWTGTPAWPLRSGPGSPGAVPDPGHHRHRRRRRWLLDLERLGAVYVTGPADRRTDFARHLAAELAVNSWSDLLTVTTVGFGDELLDLAPHRVHPTDTAN